MRVPSSNSTRSPSWMPKKASKPAWKLMLEHVTSQPKLLLKMPMYAVVYAQHTSNAQPLPPGLLTPRKSPRKIQTVSTSSTTTSTRASRNLYPTACSPSTAPSEKKCCALASRWITCRQNQILPATTSLKLPRPSPGNSPQLWKTAINVFWRLQWNVKCAQNLPGSLNNPPPTSSLRICVTCCCSRPCAAVKYWVLTPATAQAANWPSSMKTADTSHRIRCIYTSPRKRSRHYISCSRSITFTSSS